MTRLVLGLLLLACAWLAAIALRQVQESSLPDPGPIRLALEAPPDADLGSSNEMLDAAISVTGDEMVFVATREGRTQLWHRRLEDGQPTPLPGTEGAAMPAWKVGAPVVSFFTAGGLKAIHLPTGRISDLAVAPAPAGATWLPDGSLLFVPAPGPILQMANGRVRVVTSLAPEERTHAMPIAADGGSFTYVAVQGDGSRSVRLAAHPTEPAAEREGEGGAHDVELTATSGHGQLVDGYLLYTSGGALVAKEYSREQGALVGPMTALAPIVGVASSGRAMFAVSSALLVTAPPVERAHEMIWVDPAGGRGRSLAEPGDYWQVRVAPDERAIAVTATSPQLGSLDIFLLPLAESGRLQRLTLSLDADSDPVWAGNGRVVFRSWQSGRPRLFSRRAEVSPDLDQPVEGARPGDTPTDATPAGVLVHAQGGASGLDVWLIDRAGRRQQVTRGAFNEWDARWSPDGRWLAYVSDESGTPDIYLQQWPEGTRIRASSGGGTQPQWSPESRTVYFVRGSRIMRANLTTRGSPPRATVPEPVVDLGGRIGALTITPRTGRLIAIVPVEDGGPGSADVVVNWQAVVTRAAPDQQDRQRETR